MVRGHRIVAAAAAGASFAAFGVSTAAAGQAEPQQAAQQLIQNCDAHKFETVIRAVVDGEQRQSRLKLCGQTGQTQEQWIGTLKDAIAKVKANAEMAAPVREQIIAAVSEEIARLQSGAPEAPKPQPLAELPDLKPRQLATGRPKEQYSELPAMPTAPPPPPRVLGPGAPTAVAGGSAASVPAVSLAPAYPVPKLSFACFSPGDIGGDAPCTGFERETVLTVRAGEDLRKGLQLRFDRNGQARGTVELAQLRRGKSMRIPLPREVCAGFGSGRLDLQVVEGGYVVSTDGPYSLRC